MDDGARRFSGQNASSSIVVAAEKPPAVKRFVRQQVPDELLNEPELNQAITALPANYNFEASQAPLHAVQPHFHAAMDKLPLNPSSKYLPGRCRPFLPPSLRSPRLCGASDPPSLPSSDP